MTKPSIFKTNFTFIKDIAKSFPLYIFFSFIYIFTSGFNAIIELKIIELAVNELTGTVYALDAINRIMPYVLVFIIFTIYNEIYSGLVRPTYEIKYQNIMQKKVYKKSLSIKAKEFDNPLFYDLYHRVIWDAPDMGNVIFEAVIDFLKYLVNSIFIIGLIASYDPIIILIMLALSAIKVIIDFKTSKLWYKMWKDSSLYFRIKNFVNRVFYQDRYLAELKTTGVSNILLEKYDAAAEESLKIEKQTFKKVTIYEIISTFFNDFLKNLLIYSYLIYKLYHGILLGSFAMIIASNTKLDAQIANFGNILSFLKRNSYYIEEYNEFMSIKVKEDDDKEECDSFENLEIKNLKFRYEETEKLVLDKLDLTINKGDHIALVGENGCGKTTLVKLLLKLYDYEDGIILYNHKNYYELKDKSVRDKLQIVYQDYNIYHITLFENVMMHGIPKDPIKRKEEEIRCLDALDKLGLKEKVESLEDGIYTTYSREFKKAGAIFSGGEMQRLALARVFASDADIYILDEPTSNLDPFQEKKLNDLILNLGHDKTIILIAHRFSSVVDCNKICLLKDGKIIESGTNEELLKQNGIYADMFNKQKHLFEED